jgi:hypothetical protein
VREGFGEGTVLDRLRLSSKSTWCIEVERADRNQSTCKLVKLEVGSISRANRKKKSFEGRHRLVQQRRFQGSKNLCSGKRPDLFVLGVIRLRPVGGFLSILLFSNEYYTPVCECLGKVFGCEKPK